MCVLHAVTLESYVIVIAMNAVLNDIYTFIYIYLALYQHNGGHTTLERTHSEGDRQTAIIYPHMYTVLRENENKTL